MARNKHPEQTVQKILEVSLQLFHEKGYEKTTIQDIVNRLAMSKGAIYHHFKSKEEIFDALCTQTYPDFEAMKKFLAQFPQLNGLEKMRMIFHSQLSNTQKRNLDPIMLSTYANPKFLVMSMQDTLTEVSAFGATLVEEGIRDGSIEPQNSLCASQVVLLLINFWIASTLEDYDEEKQTAKVHYLRILLERMGIPIIDDELEYLFMDYMKALHP